MSSVPAMNHNRNRLITMLALLWVTFSAQGQLALVSVSEPVFHHPESIVYDAQRNCLYISNLDKETPMEDLRTDFISRMELDGRITELKLIEGLSSPTGLAIHEGRLYAVERDGVAVIDLDTRKIQQRIPIAEAGFLNDIAIDPRDGTAYVSETNPEGRIFRIQEGKTSLWLQDTALALTNGLLVRGNELLAGVNGDHFLKSVDLESRAIRKLAHLGPGNIDGIQFSPEGLLVSHFLGNLYALDPAHQVREILNTRGQDIFVADFAYLPGKGLIFVPSLRTHKIYTYRFRPPMNNAENLAHPLTWVDSMDAYAREAFLPAKKYRWTWQQAALLRAMTAQYDAQIGPEPAVYLEYVRTAMDKSIGKIRAGRNPNGIASGLGMAWIARRTGEAKYRAAAENLYAKYLEIPRTENGGVTHLGRFRELWDDTVFMVGIYLLEMHLLTGEEKYLDELLLQFEAHREKLRVEEWGLWVHGWDGDDRNHCSLCSQTGWSKNPEKRSQEIWGRGNGWVVVTLTQILESIPESHPKWPVFASYLQEMIQHLPALQDSSTGHWFQLPIYPHAEGNYIESSCTAMFGYGIAGALRMGLVEGEAYQESVAKAYAGLRKYSIRSKEGPYLSTKNVCKGTCIGDREYYFKRKAKSEKPFGLGMFILFGRAYAAL